MPFKPPEAGYKFTTTAGEIIASASQDIRKQLGTTGADQAVLLDYLNRVLMETLRRTRWPFTKSDLYYYITENEQNDYWIGPVGQGPAGVVDTGLDLPNVLRIKEDEVRDRSNQRQLKSTDQAPRQDQYNFEGTGRSRPGIPAEYMNDPNTPNIISLYPAPNNQNNHTPVPPSPICLNDIVDGSLAARIYYVKCTYTDDFGGEGVGSDAGTRVFIPANQLVSVVSPPKPYANTAAGVLYTGYNVYAGTTEQGVTLQNNSPISLGTGWTEPNTGLIAGDSLPQTSTLEPLGGYIISFRYWMSRPNITDTTTIIPIPDDYKDVIKAGINEYVFALAERQEWAQLWQQKYQTGLVQMIADKNMIPKGQDYIRPDEAATSGQGFGNLGTAPLWLP